MPTSNRWRATLAGVALAAFPLTTAACGEDVVDDGVQQEVEQGVEDAEQNVEDGVDELEQEVDGEHGDG
ncbi:hypothetical protein [Geodermatophilus ruber]|uniref:Uncharacterized protein n=1 Tax=Geodermatophilus ruber TaxID=504800 RepID=A0A1I4DZF2_9ACTN|nr:hypothetical protein [Geodermatophilus ruber]SFK97486.1 hypothetical protein SAMN04488085_10569 [Geodermatophilus ruber]